MPNELIIVSGGQTGADRAGLDFAIAHGLPHGGWCPLGRRAEDGPLHERYQMRETAKTGSGSLGKGAEVELSPLPGTGSEALMM